RPPVAWIWGGAAVMAVIIVAALVWVFSLSPQNLVGAGAAPKVPDVVGQTYKVGGNKILDEKLLVDKIESPSSKYPADQIIALDPPAGTAVAPGTHIQVTVSSGPATVTLPGLVYKSEADAEAAITAAGLVYGSTRQDHSASVPGGQVLGVEVQSLSGVQTGNISLPAGSTVNLVVSDGMVDVPDQRGQPVQAARDLLAGPTYGLSVKLTASSGCSGGKVTAQSEIGVSAQKSAVTLTYCSG
ncbi:MAG TPA: PASTA domain-containing protein, partial [Pseudolysinimonas sp.]|nr:PASTA domain-containing protein [Pseudolysinimonas sp.]